jgi:hypothetical protein
MQSVHIRDKQTLQQIQHLSEKLGLKAKDIVKLAVAQLYKQYFP